MNVVWFKKDLRVTDNEALTKSLASKDVLFVYVYEDEIISSEEYAACHHGFLNECLSELADELRQRGSDLHILRGRVPDVFDELRESYPFERLLSHEETGNMSSYRRDIRVQKWCKQNGVKWSEYTQTGVVRRLKSRDGWAQKWLKTMNKEQFHCPAKLPKPPIKTNSDLLELKDFGKNDLDKPARMIGGSKQAHEALTSFLNDRGRYYSSQMSSPLTADYSCSRMSPYLSFGAISMRQIHQALELQKLQVKSIPREMSTGWEDHCRPFREG